jgi:hypothetical protein
MLMLFGASGTASAAVVDTVEYYYAATNHYFITAAPDEISAIDAGKSGGWTRTGYTFKVQNAALSGYTPVCRFYSANLAPRNTHFYTPSAAECNGLKTNTDWRYEGYAFYVRTPDAGDACPTGSTKIYRLYNNRQDGAPNHRYISDLTVRSQMINQGWVPEGVAFCAESTSGTNNDPALASQNTSKMLNGTWSFSYTSNGSFQRDTLTFTTMANDSTSTVSPYYATGTNQYNQPVTARYNLQTGLMEVRSRFAMPATDYFTFTGDNIVSGCYYFLPTNTNTPANSCVSFTGICQ